MMINSARWFRTSSKFSGQEFEEIFKNIRSLVTPEQMRIPLSMKQIMQRKMCGSSKKPASDAVKYLSHKRGRKALKTHSFESMIAKSSLAGIPDMF